MLSSVLLPLSLWPLITQCAPTSPAPSADNQLANHLGRDLGANAQAIFIAAGSANASNSSLAQPSASSGRIASAPASTLSQPPGSVTAQGSASPLVMAYYPDWVGASFPPEKIDCTLFDWVDFAFALPDKNFNLVWDSEEAPLLLHRLVDAMHAAGKKVKLSVGGWTGSKYFSSAVATDESRLVFVGNIQSAYHEFNLDGIDIDWEYPGHEGAGGNEVNSRDSANFLLFLQILRRTLPRDAKITAAAQTVPFVDQSGQPTQDVSEFAKIVDWILLMNYDVWSSSPTPGPNSPMWDGCKNSTQPQANAVAGFNQWTTAGFPASKLVLGLPSYGYISNSNAEGLRQRSNIRSRVVRSKAQRDGSATTPSPMVKVVGEDGNPEGQIHFRELIRQGALSRSSNKPTTFEGAGGYEKHWDNCSSTWFLRSESLGQIITLDDPESLHMKADFAKRMGMLGTNMFDIHGDTDEWDLTNAVRNGLGIV